uniref:Metalloendopeptidase n=1 Tax=Strongyloides papillosus TaxID=174720 RepID=A0A0N5B763_STREA
MPLFIHIYHSDYEFNYTVSNNMVYFVVVLIIFIKIVRYIYNYVINFAINGFNNSFNKNISDDNDIKQVEAERVKRSIIKNKKFIWEFPIDYHISKRLGINAIEEALKKIQGETCVTFNKSTRHIRLKNGINFKYDKDGCSSYVGKRKEEKPQSILLDDDCKTHLGAIIHEISHTLGLNHEQSRRDRDSYIRVYRRNIEKEQRYNVAYDPWHNSQTFGISYDLSSIMHYSIFAFSSNNLSTLVPLDQNYNYTIGQENDYTFNDVKLINYLYCNDTCKNDTTPLECENFSYRDPKNCSQCRCPHGFAGTNCTILQPQSDPDKCGTHYYNATDKVSNMTKTGIMNCTFHIKAEHGGNITVTVENVVASPPDPSKFLLCFSKMGLEIKHKIDTSVTGLCLCGVIKKTFTINSEGDEVFIMWYGKENNHTFTLTYKEVNSTNKIIK